MLPSCASEAPAPAGRMETPPAGGSATNHEYEYLRDETQQLVQFLRGGSGLEPALLADTITLQIAPEGGGQQRRVSKEELQERTQWRVGSRSLLPPSDLTDLTTAAGLHFNCFPVPLESQAPDFGSRPHVGARLASPENATCLQTWNATFVFDDDPISPSLVAVIYDQWEW